jgi:hypothetical protein
MCKTTIQLSLTLHVFLPLLLVVALPAGSAAVEIRIIKSLDTTSIYAAPFLSICIDPEDSDLFITAAEDGAVLELTADGDLLRTLIPPGREPPDAMPANYGLAVDPASDSLLGLGGWFTNPGYWLFWRSSGIYRGGTRSECQKLVQPLGGMTGLRGKPPVRIEPAAGHLYHTPSKCKPRRYPHGLSSRNSWRLESTPYLKNWRKLRPRRPTCGATRSGRTSAFRLRTL